MTEMPSNPRSPSSALRKVALFSKEYPPHVYGGAGVHVEYLARALAKSVAVEVRCFGEQTGKQAL